MAKRESAATATTTVTHVREFDAPPKTIFDMYVEARRHAKVIDAPVRFDKRVGGAFSAWGGGVSGINVLLRSPGLIVQAWRTEEFPSGHFSILQLRIDSAGRGRSRLTLTQHGVPRDCAAEIESNWQDCYWTPMERLLAEKRRD